MTVEKIQFKGEVLKLRHPVEVTTGVSQERSMFEVMKQLNDMIPGRDQKLRRDLKI